MYTVKPLFSLVYCTSPISRHDSLIAYIFDLFQRAPLQNTLRMQLSFSKIFRVRKSKGKDFNVLFFSECAGSNSATVDSEC